MRQIYFLSKIRLKVVHTETGLDHKHQKKIHLQNTQVKCDIVFANFSFLYIHFICLCEQPLNSANHFNLTVQI